MKFTLITLGFATLALLATTTLCREQVIRDRIHTLSQTLAREDDATTTTTTSGSSAEAGGGSSNEASSSEVSSSHSG